MGGCEPANKTGSEATIADSDLISACRCGDNNALRKALRDGANINGTDASGRNALMHAAAKGHAVKEGPDRCLELLINAKAALDLNCNLGWTAIHYAVVNNHEAAVEKLIYARCDPAEDNCDKKTPLHLARQLGLSNMDKMLSDPEDVIARCAKRYKNLTPSPMKKS